LSELSQVVGLEKSLPKKRREMIGKYLGRIEDKSGKFSYLIKKIRGENDWNILIEFKPKDLIDTEYFDEFYSVLVDCYGVHQLNQLDLTDIDVHNMKNEYMRKFETKTGKKVMLFQKEEVNPVEFVIDVTLFQLSEGYILNSSFKALFRAMYENFLNDVLDLPDRYRFFARKRLGEEKKKVEAEKISKEITRRSQLEHENELKLNAGFEEFFENFLSKDKKLMERLKLEAKDLLEAEGLGEGSPTHSLVLKEEIMKRARSEFDSSELMKHIKVQ
jgi:hypothetical protein